MYQPVRADIDRYKPKRAGTGGTSRYGPIQNPKWNKNVPISLSYRNGTYGTGTKLITLVYSLCPILDSQQCAKRGNCRHPILSGYILVFMLVWPRTQLCQDSSFGSLEPFLLILNFYCVVLIFFVVFIIFVYFYYSVNFSV